MRARRALRCHCLSARACNLSAREIVTLVRVRSLSLIACALAARCDVTVSLNHSLSNLCQAKRCASRASVTAAAADDASKTLAAEQSDAEAARDTDAVVRVTARDTALAAAHEILSSAAACDEAEHSHARDTEAETVSRAAAEIEARLFDLRFEFDERAHEKAPNLWVCHPSNRAYALSVENPSEESSLEPDMASGDGARSLRSDASHGLVSQDTLTRGIMHPHFIVSRSVRCRPDRQRPLVVLGTSACNTSRARFSHGDVPILPSLSSHASARGSHSSVRASTSTAMTAILRRRRVLRLRQTSRAMMPSPHNSSLPSVTQSARGSHSSKRAATLMTTKAMAFRLSHGQGNGDAHVGALTRSGDTGSAHVGACARSGAAREQSVFRVSASSRTPRT